jgi:hypothetical protein
VRGKEASKLVENGLRKLPSEGVYLSRVNAN